MALSANTLFHFTSKSEYLIGILSKGFLPRYCLESVSYLNDNELINSMKDAEFSGFPTKLAFPIVCFCDIKLTQTKDHANHYGKFVIGMKKEWGIRNKVSPVQYFHPNSNSTRLYAEVFTLLQDGLSNASGVPIEKLAEHPKNFSGLPRILLGAYNRLCILMVYYKSIDGYEIRNGEKQHVYYYDEREWRFSPVLKNMPEEGMPILMQEEIFNDSIKKRNYQDKMEQHLALTFSEEDIKYIILPDKSHLLSFKEDFMQSGSLLDYDFISPKIRFYTEIEEDN